MVTLLKGSLAGLKDRYLAGCQVVGATVNAPKTHHIQLGLFALGVTLLACGLSDDSFAKQTVDYNDSRIRESANAVLTYLEGSFGALVMVASGIGAILSAAFGQYRAALGLMVVAIGSFILRSLMSTFFNDKGIQT